MAAAGLSNKEIGQKLHLARRTVGSDLYRMFSKLGISLRSEPRDALPAPDTDGELTQQTQATSRAAP